MANFGVNARIDQFMVLTDFQRDRPISRQVLMTEMKQNQKADSFGNYVNSKLLLLEYETRIILEMETLLIR